MNRPSVCPVGATTCIFVEGGDEQRFCAALVPGVPVFWMKLEGHDESVLRRVDAAIRDPGWDSVTRVGVVLDAEEDPERSALLAQSVLRRAGLNPPDARGVVDGERRCGWYLLPGGVDPGSLETLLRRAADPSVAACVDALFACTPNPGTTQARRDKAWVAAWLAAAVGNARVDQAWQDAASPGAPAFEGLRAFLQALTA